MTWYHNATVRHGPEWKCWADPNSHTGVILHSAEGYEGGLWSQLDGDAQAAWHFTILQDGRVFQHYDLDKSPWHAGNKQGNITLIGVEHEGIKGQELTEVQLEASKALVAWLGTECGWTPSRDEPKTLWEHHEVPGASTTCPNDRIPWDAYKPAPLYDAPAVEWIAEGWGAVTTTPWRHKYQMRAKTLLHNPLIDLIPEGVGEDGWYHFRLEVEDYPPEGG